MKKESSFNLALPAAIMPFVAPIAAQAAEGTGLVSYIIIINSIIRYNKTFYRYY